MPQSKKLIKFISTKECKIFRCKFFMKVEAIIYGQDIEGRNYALTRTAVKYPSITFLQIGEFERLKSEGVKEISLDNAFQMQKEFLSKKQSSLRSVRVS